MYFLLLDSDQALPPHNKENNSKGRSSWWNKKQTCVLFPSIHLYEHYIRKHPFPQVLFLSILHRVKTCQNKVYKIGVSAGERYKIC